MSRLTELLRQARKVDPQLGKDLEAEVAALMKRRTFGLVFEQHQPEAVELPGRAVRRGDKVRVLPPRGEVKPGDQRLWRVEQIERADSSCVAHLLELDAEEPETQVVLAEDLVVVAEFRDRIYPGLVETGRVERGGDKPFHTVINAENYHALEMLTYTHRHSIDAIYIDPPYNTGAKDWKYNNNYVEGDDDYRHSKWLAFMERRLEIARELLNPNDSVLIVTIDEKEYLRLGMLLEQTFPEARIQMVSSVINPKGVSRGDSFRRSDEYIFFVMFGASAPQRMELGPEWLGRSGDASDGRSNRVDSEPGWTSMMRRGSNSARSDRPGLFYPIYVNPGTGRIEEVGQPLAKGVHDAPEIADLVATLPLRRNGSEGRWQIGPDELRSRLSQGRVKTGRRTNYGYVINYLPDGAYADVLSGRFEVSGRAPDGSILARKVGAASLAQIPFTQWRNLAHNASENGSSLLSALLHGRKFPFPKSLYAVEDALRFFVKNKSDATILDFFSGSGTTAHAVMRLNKQDEGRRQCISVTNNEVSADEQRGLRKVGVRPGDPDWEALGICDYITKPRVTAAITGKTPEGDPIKGDYKFSDEFPMADGFEENAAFFTLTYESPLAVRHDRAFAKVAPMLWLRAGSQGRIIEDLGEDGWDVAEAYGVLKNMDQLSDFVARVEEVETVQTVFVVTDSDAAFQMTCRDLPSRVRPIRLYESYLHNFAINRRDGA
ncbi:site-specific DNA-methyltransferase [Micrococcus terreus]|uniref:site-specific DNA-methyltransferase n=1 Tax=Micrococcus terreus TaxID=574650 RepID=UPI0023F8B3C8|nr:DNA methyltransferase [Micrococcus terreus]